MSVVASDIVVYASQNMPQDDLSTAGGAINSGIRLVFTDIETNSVISAYSDDNSDSGTLTITGRDAAGIIVSENIALSGTTTVSGSQVFERILSSRSDTVAIGNISVSGATEVGTIFPTESGFQRVFYDATANSTGGSDKFGLEKSLNYNESVGNRLNAPTGVTSYGDGASGVAGNNLTPLDAQGIWLKMELAAGTSSTNSFYRIQVEGTTI